MARFLLVEHHFEFSGYSGKVTFAFLFQLAIEPLQRIFASATEAGILKPITHILASIGVSLYADDAALLLNPCKSEMMATQAILEAFGRISRLYTNFNKSSAFPICCDELATNEVLSEFAGTTDSFPCKYLGLPLSLHNLGMPTSNSD
ncbi:uncharacterized protein [Aegilops tauschii subsp. strangulata]|uniref:uncharacterized protein n=1 Tax=Aegilops tauschii subsp. strangulata TaxID=200361 RepID=UPI003CC875ED